MSSNQSNTKKKWFIGCGVTFVISLIIIAVAVYFVLQKAKSIIGDLKTEPREYSKLIEEDRFTPPADGLIQEEELKTYIQISTEIQTLVDQRLSDEETSFNWKEERNYLNLIGKLYDMRKIQAEVLKKYHFSPNKYRWITRQLVLIFGGDLVKQMNIFIRARGSDIQEIDSSREIRSIPEQNLNLFNKYEKEIENIIGLWVLGV